MNILLSKKLQALHENRLPGLNCAQLMPELISASIDELAQRDGVSKRVLGYSFLKQPIHCFTLGRGPTAVLIWTQMHGDESTATAAVLDLINLLSAQTSVLTHENNLDANWRNELTVHIVPMLNPDGALAGTRENAQGIDINRDALALQTPEGRILNALVSEIRPEFAFNLHDQHDYYRCGSNGKSSTLAFLAPVFDAEKTIDAARQKAMALISLLHSHASPLLPEGIARYDDEFSARSFGDQIAKRGISTILIESGHYPDDNNRQVARCLNVMTLIHALNHLCKPNEWTEDKSLEDLEQQYWLIPENRENSLCDILIQQVGFSNGDYATDVAVRKTSRFASTLIVDDIGDLSEQHGFRTIDARTYTYDPGRSYLLSEKLVLSNQSYLDLLQQGFSHFVGNADLIINNSDYMTIENPKYWHDDHKMMKGITPAGFLCKGTERKFVILMGDIFPL